MSETRQIGILFFDGGEELDAIGPWQVLRMWTENWPQDGWRVFSFSEREGPVQCSKGMRVIPQHTDDDRPELDVLVYPGGKGTRGHLTRPDRIDWVRQQSDRGTLMTSVCTGSLVYAAAGILHQRPATTYWAALDELRELDATIEVRGSDRFVDDGDVITASGVSAGIDMALHLVARLSTYKRAAEVRRAIQYDPDPPVANPSWTANGK